MPGYRSDGFAAAGQPSPACQQPSPYELPQQHYARFKGDAVVTVAVDTTFGCIELEPNTEPVNYTCVRSVWRTINPTDVDSWNTSERQ